MAFSSGYYFSGIYLRDDNGEISHLMQAIAETTNMEMEDIERCIADSSSFDINGRQIYFVQMDDTCESIRFTNLDGEEWFLDDYILCVRSDRQPSLFSQAYRSKDEFINEFKAKLNGLVPADFPWEERAGEFQCSVNC